MVQEGQGSARGALRTLAVALRWRSLLSVKAVSFAWDVCVCDCHGWVLLAYRDISIHFADALFCSEHEARKYKRPFFRLILILIIKRVFLTDFLCMIISNQLMIVFQINYRYVLFTDVLCVSSTFVDYC